MDQLPKGLASQAVPWGLMLLTLGSVTGAVAGAICARALNSSLAVATSDTAFHEVRNNPVSHDNVEWSGILMRSFS